ncbi:MAG: penicillin-binding protein [Melioribacteraceae bacterium]|nr:penicillin-binding protein [Melioribacteraceae bacterium]
MNPNTGEIVALANYPAFEPSKYFRYNDIIRRNRALTDTYEPGSTMKALTMSILLDNDLVSEDEMIDTENGRYKISNAKIIDVNKFEKLTVREVLEQSSNVGITKLSDRIDDRTFYKYLRDFGFGNATSVTLPSEAAGYLKKPDHYSKLSKPFMAFGYEISVTPLQMVTAFSALVNGGNLYQPRIVDKIVDEKGRIIEEFESTKIRNVISSETSERIKNLLFGVVEHGTGKLARCNNMLVGGKTGTSQKYVDGEYVKDYNASFIGFFPADNPEVVGLILLSSPATGKYGGVIAAPVFKKIVTRIVEEDIRVAPQKISIAREEESLNKILETITNSEEPVFLQTANVGEEAPHIENVSYYASRVTMPNLMNRSLREALAILNEMGLRYDVNGSGRVVSQSIKAGSKITRGSVCLIECEATNTLTTLGIY